MFSLLDKTESSFGLLPPPGHGIAYWGGSDGGAITDAGQTQMYGAMNATNVAQDWFNRAAGYLAPWRQAGSTALTQIGGLLGLPGYSALDPTQTLLATPGYRFLQEEGTRARDLSAASRGLALSGAQQKGLADWNQNLALTKAWSPYMSALQGLSGQGLGAAGQTGNWAITTGAEIGQDVMAGAQAQAQAAINAANARNQGGNDWISALGLAGGLALAPFTGGTSLIGSGMSALRMLGGGGGGGAGQYNTGGYGSGTAFGNTMPTVSSLLNMGFPAMADGGPVMGGQTAIVGERGPELVTFDRPGYVIPNHALPAWASVSATRPWNDKADPGYIFPPYVEPEFAALESPGAYAMIDLMTRRPRVGLSTNYGNLDYAFGEGR